MQQPIFCTAGETEALHHAKNQLIQWGYPVFRAPTKAATHLLLPVPSFESPGMIKGGRSLDEILPYFSPQITIFGGNLGQLPCSSVDFLKDEYYLGENAQITAQCTLSILQQQCHLQNAAVLVIGWGRIGKCLAAQLRVAGCRVQVAARQESDRAMLDALGYQSVSMLRLSQAAEACRLLFNTVPAPVLQADHFSCVKIDLASVRGLSGSDVIWARGLPGKMAPTATGRLMGETVLRLLKEEEV